MEVTVTESVTTATVAGTSITATIAETINTAQVSTVGAQGAPGASATVTVGTTTTGAAGSSATVTNTGTLSAAVFNFTIPRGDTGAQGATGATGASGVVTVTSPITNTGTAGSAVIGIDQSLLALSPSQITGTAITLSSGTALAAVTASTATYAVTAGTASYSTTSGTAVFATSAGSSTTASTATYATTSGTATYATTSGTAAYATLSGTATYSTTSGTAVFGTNAGTAVYATNAGAATTAGTATYATTSGTAVNISGTIAPAQVTGTAAILGANTFTGKQTFAATSASAASLNIPSGITSPTSPVAGDVWVATGSLRYYTGAQTNSFAFSNIDNGFTSTQSFNPALATVGLLVNTASADGIQVAAAATTVFSVNRYGALTVSPSLGTAATVNGVTDAVSLIVKGGSANTAALQQWQNSASTVLAKVDAAGGLTLTPSSGTAATVNAVSSAIGLVIKANATTPGNFAEFQASDSTVLASISSIGKWQALVASGSAATTSDQMFDVGRSGDAGSRFYINGFGMASIRTNQTTPYGSNNSLGVGTGSAVNIGAIIRGVASQTGDLQQWQASGGTILGGRNAVAQIYSGSTAPVTVATGGATTAASGTGTVATITTTSAHGLAVGDLVTVAGVTPTGYNATAVVTAVTSTTFSYANTTTGAQTVAGTVSVPAQASFTARSAGTVGLSIRAAASPVANLVEINSSSGSGGNLLVVGTDGRIASASVIQGISMRLNGLAGLGGGLGVFAINNATTVPTSNNTGGGILYAEAGALKWRGSSGTITTIAAA